MHLTPEAIVMFPILLFSIICHEIGHAFAAHLGGDDTAKDAGRISFNPIPHIDPVGTIILPALALFSGFPLIGWAKPVPVNSRNLRSPQWSLIVAVAGVSMNFLLAILALIIYRIVLLFGVDPLIQTSDGQAAALWASALQGSAFVNLLLMVFNLIPIPPLDGSHFLFYFARTRESVLFKALEFFERFGFIILLALLWLGVFSKVIIPIIVLIFVFLYKILMIPGPILI